MRYLVVFRNDANEGFVHILTIVPRWKYAEILSSMTQSLTTWVAKPERGNRVRLWDRLFGLFHVKLPVPLRPEKLLLVMIVIFGQPPEKAIFGTVVFSHIQSLKSGC